MKLNPDCVRDILLTIEAASFGKQLTLPSLSELLPGYSQEELHYTCLKLNEGGYVDVSTGNVLGRPMPQIFRIRDLTFSGHEFLESVKPDTVWEKTKSKALKIGSFSLNTLKDIATNVLTDLIKSNF